MFHVCHAVLPVNCSLVVTCWERADLLALMFVMVYCVFVPIPYVVLDQEWYLSESIPYLCLLPYFHMGIFAYYQFALYICLPILIIIMCYLYLIFNDACFVFQSATFPDYLEVAIAVVVAVWSWLLKLLPVYRYRVGIISYSGPSGC